MLVSHFALLVVAFVLAVVFTAITREVALFIGLVDAPDRNRKIHARATPLGGGVAVLLALCATIAITSFAPSVWGEVVRQQIGELRGLALAVLVLCVVGVVDDFQALRARQKFAGQIVACAIAMSSNLVVEHVQFFGHQIDLGLLAWPFTLFWLLGAINSVNLIDGADGLAATVGIILTTTIAGMAMLTGHDLEALVALALAGALLGFLVFNFPPATIFLGDAGSMCVGLLAGVLAMRCAFKGAASYAMIAPLAIWAVPAFDCSIAIVRRKLTGRSIAATDRGHLHHCLLRRGFDNRQMLIWVAVLCLITATGAIVSLRLDNELYAIGSVLVMVAAMVLTRIFGHAEFLLIANTLSRLSVSFIVPAHRQRQAIRQSAFHLQGSRDWDSLWAMLIETADAVPLHTLRLNLNIPWLHESYHASWSREPKLAPADCWRVETPLAVGGRIVGTIAASGLALDGPVASRMKQWSQRLNQVEERLAKLLAPSAPTAHADSSFEYQQPFQAQDPVSVRRSTEPEPASPSLLGD
ncbi:MAG TPA: MraY family glycosyltransferase [Pirellulales bacterium]|nr:MraY family glycosyltransferase [Pirellulales bacterium]